VGHTNADGTPRGREVAWVCDDHLMGDGQGGRRDWGWRRVSTLRLVD
jgi:hypothetical protein